jgi:hypothetical protein
MSARPSWNQGNTGGHRPPPTASNRIRSHDVSSYSLAPLRGIRSCVRLAAVKNKISFAFAFILFASTLAYATTVQRLAFEDLVKKAQHIVAGKVRDSRTYWNSNRKLILTSYTVEVDETIKGQSQRTFELTTIGGKIGDLELRVSGMPSFEKGENIVVFTEPSGPYQVVLGLGQGKFTVENGQVSNDISDLSFPDGRPGTGLKLPVETFKNRIRNILNQ